MYRQSTTPDPESGGYVSIPLEKANEYIPDATALEKHGKFGKMLARNRPRLLCFAAVLMVAAAFAFCAMFIFVIYQFVRPRASGLDMHTIDNADKSSLLVGDTRVLNVVSPVEAMNDVAHAVLLLNDPRFANYTHLTREEIGKGYLPWSAAPDRPRVNFTLGQMEELLKEKTDAEKSTCVCYAAYGLPYNIVYLADSQSFLYEPRVKQEFVGKVVRVTNECVLHDLLKEARGGGGTHTGEDHTMTTNSSGIVESITVGGSRVRKVVDGAEFPCIKHCIEFFD